MPFSIHKLGGGKYSVTSPHGTKAKGTTKKKAIAQVKLLHWKMKHGEIK